MDPEMLARIGSISFMIGLIFVLMIIQLSFICVRVDKTVSWIWAVVFIPVYVVLALLVLGSFLSLLQRQPVPEPTEEEPHPRRSHYGPKLVTFVYISLVAILFGLLPSLIDQTVPYWWWMIPYGLVEGFHIVVKMVTLRTVSQNAESVSWPMLLLDAFYVQAIRVVQVVMILAYVNGNLNNITWGVVFIPVYLLPCLTIVKLVVDYKARKAHATPSNPNIWRQFYVQVFSSVFGYFLLYLTLGLIIAKLQGSSISLSVAIIPVWIVLSLFVCVFSCCIPCASFAGGVDLESSSDDLRVSPNLRIEANPGPSANL
jgi:hypothetical protein